MFILFYKHFTWASTYYLFPKFPNKIKYYHKNTSYKFILVLIENQQNYVVLIDSSLHIISLFVRMIVIFLWFYEISQIYRQFIKIISVKYNLYLLHIVFNNQSSEATMKLLVNFTATKKCISRTNNKKRQWQTKSIPLKCFEE